MSGLDPLWRRRTSSDFRSEHIKGKSTSQLFFKTDTKKSQPKYPGKIYTVGVDIEFSPWIKSLSDLFVLVKPQWITRHHATASSKWVKRFRGEEGLWLNRHLTLRSPIP